VTVETITRFGIRPEWREAAYRIVTGVVGLLASFAYLAQEEAALWTQLGISSVTLLFAALFATSTWRAVLYPVLATGGALLTWYGVVADAQLPLILAAAAQLFGLSTAAAKVVTLPHQATPPPHTLAA
jgi:hypothetical protein